MIAGEEQKVRCPGCGCWVVCIKSLAALVEVNCTNGRCRAKLLVRCENQTITVNVIDRKKQA